MTVKRIDQSALEAWVDTLAGEQTVYGATAKGDKFAFGPVRGAGDLRLDYDVTILPPKKYFQPAKEDLMTFDAEGRFQTVLTEDPFVLFGVHPYDFEAITQMDQVFAEPHYDVHYGARRAGATVIVSDAQAVSASAFAGSVGVASGGDVDGFDVLLTRLDDGAYLVDVRTEKGEAATASLAGGDEAGEADLAAREQVWTHNREQLQRHQLTMKVEDIPGLLDQGEDHPVWAEKAARCYSCGSCNLVCPTCYCFDVQDDLNWDLKSGRRYRAWDGCMLKAFACVAGNHNFRGQTAARYRHRYYRKGKYMYETLGRLSCVGCGRCISACTAKIANPVEMFNRLQEDV